MYTKNFGRKVCIETVIESCKLEVYTKTTILNVTALKQNRIYKLPGK